LPALVGFDTALWLPLERVQPLFIGPAEQLTRTEGRIFLRPRSGAALSAVESEFELRYDDDLPPPPGLEPVVLAGLHFGVGRQEAVQRQLAMFLAGSLLLALVAGANTSLFLLARAPARRRELGVRMAVGATTLRLARQLVTEAGLLVIGSAVLGVLLGVWLDDYLRTLAFMQFADWRNVTLLDWRVFGLLAAFLLALTVLVSLAPVLAVARSGIGTASRSVTARATIGQRVAGTAQLAAAGAFGAAA